jgi:transcriptional regulator with XRE-family HTH domain
MTDIFQTRIYSVAFPERLTAARKARGLTQEGLGKMAELTKLQIHRYERGASQPTLEALKRLAIALNASIDELVFEDEERKPEGELQLLFEGVSRLDPGEQQLIKELIESIMLKHDAKRYFKQEATR